MIIKRYDIANGKKETLDKFMKEKELELWKHNVKAVEHCLNNDLDEYEAYIVDPCTQKFYVFRKKFKEILKVAIKIFEKYEEYELCANVTKLLNRIK